MQLAIDNLSFSYGAVTALEGVSMTLEPGRIGCIIGQTGCFPRRFRIHLCFDYFLLSVALAVI